MIAAAHCRRILVLGLLSIAIGCRSQPRAAAPASPVDARPLTVIGLCEDYPEESRSIERAERDLALLEQTGVTRLRVALGWDGIEPRAGEFDWSFWDEFFDLADRHHVTLLPYVCYTPTWAARSAEHPWRQPPKDVQAFATFVEAAATRYRGRVQSWELWNEPDNREYWEGSVEDYAALVHAGAAAVRRADPQAKVVLGGIAWETSFVQELLAEHHIADDVDVINVHDYSETWSPEPIEEIPSIVAGVADAIDRWGDGERIWMAEVGYSDQRRGAEVSSVYTARYRYEHTADYQADALVRMLTLAMSTGRVDLFAWYRIHDLPGEQDVIGDVNNRHLGLLSVSGQPKPAATALRKCVELLGGVTHCIDAEVSVDRPIRSAARVHAFERADGKLVVIAWLQTTVPGSGVSPGDAADARQETIELTLPSDARVVDHFIVGDRADVSNPELVGGRRLRLHLRASQTSMIALTTTSPTPASP